MNTLYYLNLCANKENFGQYCLDIRGRKEVRKGGWEKVKNGGREEVRQGGSEVVFRKYCRVLL